VATARTAPENLEALMTKYEPVIGLEVHVQLLTRSKIFCGCSTKFGAPPNSNTCPVCLGLPGALPVLNREAVAMAVKAALALNCVVNRKSIFARKNYFYPDLPKGYQISQFDQPLAEHGWIVIHTGGAEKKIGITRLHLEEDAGKSVHDGFLDSDRKTYVDLNRSGVPLSEIVSEPDLRTPEEAYDYLTRLKQTLLYLGVSDCNMEEGSLRCDANVSVRPRGQKEFGVKTEVKNLNSFRFLARALEYEIGRQIQVLEEGGRITQETRLWNANQGRTEGMRSKEQAHDYRYFPEPDLLPLIVSDAWRDEIRGTIPELPEAKRLRFIQDYGLSEYDADILTETIERADFYEEVVDELRELWRVTSKTSTFGESALSLPLPKLAANWLITNLLGLLKKAQKDIGLSPVKAKGFAGVLIQVIEGEVCDKLTSQSDKLMEQQSSVPANPQSLAVQPEGHPVDITQFARTQAQLKELNDKVDSIGGGITADTAKTALEQMFVSGKIFESAESARMAIGGDGGKRQPYPAEKLRETIRQVVASNPKQLEQYKAGKIALFGYFVGQVMKETKGQANPQKVNELLKVELEKS
jgi:aspartyl-tRNA(Asn)/glutamyl-tRNA(Gln) amidotransferase subunit B